MADTTVPDIRSRILLAAKTLFAKQGFDGTTVRQVCEAAGANVALVSYHFGGKENLFKALFEESFPKQQEMDAFNEVLAKPEEGLAALVEQVMKYTFRDPDLTTIIEQEIALRSPRIEFIREKVFPFWGKFRDLLRQGREEGVFRFRSLDTTLLMVFGAMLFHKREFYFRPLLTEGPQQADELIADTVAFIYGALGASHLIPGGKPR